MPTVLRNKTQVDLPISQLTAQEWADWTATHPEEVAKMDGKVDELRSQGKVQFLFRNGQLAEANSTAETQGSNAVKFVNGIQVGGKNEPAAS